MKTKSLFCILFFLLIVSCSTKENFVGKYHSNFPELGFFGTTINFKKDSTFDYTWSGDLEHKFLTGTYKIYKSKVYLKFHKKKGEIDSVAFKNNFAEMYNVHNYELNSENEINFHLKFKIKKNKLFYYHINTGKIVKKSQYYGKRRFGFFGPKKYFRKRFLVKK